MKLVGIVATLLLLSSVALAKKGGEKKGSPARTVNVLKTKAGSIAFTCTPSNCREQQDGSHLFNLSCQTNKENDKVEVYVGDKGRTIQSFGFVEIPVDLKAPKKGSVPIKIAVSEEEGSPQTFFTFKYTVEQIKRPSCHKYGDLEL